MKRFYVLMSLLLTLNVGGLWGQITVDGNITETDWTALSQNDAPAYTTYAAPSFGAGREINGLYASFDGTNVYLAIAGNILAGDRIALFMDVVTGGYNACNFGRGGAPQGVDDINNGVTFDAGFDADFCLIIGEFGGNYFWDLYTLTGTLGSGGGPNVYLGDNNTPVLPGTQLKANPANGSLTQGFEMAIPATALAYVSGTLKFFGMVLSDGGFISNHTLAPALNGQGNFGNGGVNFGGETPNPVSYTPPTLPVHLLSFRAEALASEVSLSWTAREEAFSHYDIERQQAGGEFSVIGRVEGRGSLGEEVSYFFADTEASLQGQLAYRLSMVDIDGTRRYSQVQEVVVNRRLVAFSPNPTEGMVTITLPAPVMNQARLDIYNLQGQLLRSEQLSGQGRQHWDLNLSDLPAGSYQARILWDGQQQAIRFSLY